MSKHTKGPWLVQKHEGQLYIVADQGKKWDNPTICNLYDDVTPSDSVTIGPWLEAFENAEHNAPVLAAAPKMLAALREFVKTMEGLPPSDETSLRVWDAYHTAKAAIAETEVKP